MRKQIFSIAVIAAFAIPSLASADVDNESLIKNKVVVSYDVKEAYSDSGRAELERKIRRAADQVCGPRTVRQAGSLKESMNNRACYNNAVAKAMKAVDGKSAGIAAVSSS